MMKAKFLIVVLGLFLQGCAGIYNVVEFEVLEPATVSFPEQVKQLMVLNRAPFTLQSIHEDNRGDMDLDQLVILDTTITNNLFRGLLKVLQQSPIERFHHPFWNSERRIDTASLRDLILTRREVESICEKYAADAIISLEYYTIEMGEVIEYYEDDPGVVMSQYYPVSNRLEWSIYIPGNPKPFDTYTITDTLFFSRILDGELQPIPSALDMITELSFGSGLKYGEYLVPVWTHASRLLYKGRGESLKQASGYTDQGDWDHAYEIWEDLTSSNDSTLVSKAFNNMAIFYELEDNLDSAALLLNRALEYDRLEQIINYKEELDTRILNRYEVLNQVR